MTSRIEGFMFTSLIPLKVKLPLNKKSARNIKEKITKNRKPNYNNTLLESLSKEFNDIEKKITLFHADVVNKILKESNLSIDLIGFHGQTIFHNPLENNPQQNKSIQLGDGKLLSKLTNKTVIYNFRQNDINNGGEGAPLTPIFHYLLSKNVNEKFQINFPAKFYMKFFLILISLFLDEYQTFLVNLVLY